MIKKSIIILLTLILMFLLGGCNNKTEKKPMESIDIDFNIKSVTNGTMEFDYPSDEWEEIESVSPDIPVMLIPANAEVLDTNINIVKSADIEMPLEKFLEGLPILYEQIDPSIKVVLSEIRTIGDVKIAYNENSIKYTEKTIEKGLKDGIYTDNIIEASGGKEAILNIPEQKQIQMTLYLDNKDVTITGTYLDDTQKDLVLKAMTTMIQTAKLK